MGSTFCGEVQEENYEEDIEEWLVENSKSLHTTYENKEMKDVEKYNINITVGNGQKMKCKLKVSININF